MIEIVISIGLVILGFAIAETRNTLIGEAERGTKKIFSLIGILVTQKDIQRLVLAFLLGIAFMILSKGKLEDTWLNGLNREIYFFIGLFPSTVLHYFEKYANKKLE